MSATPILARTAAAGDIIAVHVFGTPEEAETAREWIKRDNPGMRAPILRRAVSVAGASVFVYCITVRPSGTRRT